MRLGRPARLVMDSTCAALRYSVTQAKGLAVECARAQMRAAAASLKAVEQGIQRHALARDYAKLKEIAEASGLAAKVLPCTF